MLRLADKCQKLGRSKGRPALELSKGKDPLSFDLKSPKTTKY